MTTRFARAALLAIIPAFFLAACGGGGGGGSGSSSGSSSGGGGSTAAGIVITTSNSQALAAEALQLSSNADAAATGAGLVTGVQVSGGSTTNPLLLASATRALLRKLPTSSSMATGVVASQTVACTNGGSLTVTVDSASGGSTLSAGDSYQLVANVCTEGTGDAAMVMNGSMTITVLSGSYDPAGAYPRSVTMRVVARNFSVTGGGVTDIFSSDMTFTLTEHSATSASLSISNSTLTSNVGTHTVTLSNYSLSATETSSGTEISMSATVQTNNGLLGSSPVTYTVTTVTPIKVSSTGVVTAGAIRVTGNGSGLLLTVTGPDTFSLQVDTNGDGGYESTTTVTRGELKVLL